MKKIYISIFIFLLLIAFSSLSYATYVDWWHSGTYDNSSINFTAPTQQNFQDLIDLSHTLITDWGYDDIVDFENCDILMFLDPSYYQGACIYLFYYNPSSVAYSRNNSSSIEFFINQNTARPNFIFCFRFISTGNYNTPYTGYNSDTWSGSDYNNEMVGTSSTPTYYYSTQDLQSTRGNIKILASNTALAVTNPFNSSSGGDGGGNDDEEQETGILDFISNFWSNLVHIVVPTSEQWEDLQDSWQDNILDKFNIQTWSFSSSSLDYNYTNQWQDSSAPILEFQFMGSTCRFELEYINTLFNMPLSSVLKISKYSDPQTEVGIQYGFNGLTLKNLISFVLAIELTLTNIYLYNKFFNKGGGE